MIVTVATKCRINLNYKYVSPAVHKIRQMHF